MVDGAVTAAVKPIIDALRSAAGAIWDQHVQQNERFRWKPLGPNWTRRIGRTFEPVQRALNEETSTSTSYEWI